MKETVRFQESAVHRLLRLARTLADWRSEGHSARQLWNVVLCKGSMRRLVTKPWGKPYGLLIEPTSACNLRCPLCPTGRGTLGRRPGMMDMSLYSAILDESRHWVSRINLSNYGEPLLHPNIVEMIEMAKKCGIYVTLASNLHPLHTDELADRLVASGMDYIYISFDGVDQETYVDYRRGGRFDTLVSAVRRLVDAKRKAGSRTPFIELQYIVMRHNEGRLDEFRRLAGELGVDGIALKPLSFNNADWDDEAVLEEFRRRYPIEQAYHLYQVDEGAIRWKAEKTKRVCLALWYTLTVFSDGTVVPCCLDPRGELALGNAREGLLKAWYSERACSLRFALKSGDGRPPVCSRCCGV